VETLDVDALLTASEVARYAGVSVQAVINWRERGHLNPAVDDDGNEILDDHGHRMYRLLAAAKAEHATRKRARR
jgi:DNA-binding transcriptional MerR regulator